MLVLTRRISEAINVGDNIKFTILDVRGGQVRIGIEAPEDVPINREEIHLRIQEEKLKQQGTVAHD